MCLKNSPNQKYDAVKCYPPLVALFCLVEMDFGPVCSILSKLPQSQKCVEVVPKFCQSCVKVMSSLCLHVVFLPGGKGNKEGAISHILIPYAL